MMRRRILAVVMVVGGLTLTSLGISRAIPPTQTESSVDVNPRDILMSDVGAAAPAEIRIQNNGRRTMRCVGIGLDCAGASHFRYDREALGTDIEPGESGAVACSVSCPDGREFAFDVHVFLCDANMTWESVIPVTGRCLAVDVDK